MDRRQAFDLAYLACASLIIFGLMRLASPRTAVRGNQVAAAAMGVIIAVTLWDSGAHNLAWIIVGATIGGAIGAYSARAVKMTAMPQMVALFNGVGGGAAALIAFSEFHTAAQANINLPTNDVVSTLFSAIVGCVSFAGSMVAFGKLQELITGSPVTMPGQKIVNAALFLLVIALAGWQFAVGQNEAVLVVTMALALALGVIMVMAIGGADMPVVISLLNSFTGLAAAATGFVLNNDALIIAGTLVGASGTLLTQMMGRAMNRSIAQRAVRRLRHRRRRGGGGGRRGRWPGAGHQRRRRGRDARLRPPGRHRARLRPGGRAGPAQRARAGRPAAEARRRRAATRSIRWPDECPAT